MTAKTLLAVSAMIEAVTGIALVIAPALVVELLFGDELSGGGLALGRFAGLGLFSFGVACWPFPGPTVPALRAMLIYNSLAVVYLVYLRAAIGLDGELIWPTIAIHGVLTILLGWAWFRSRADH